jgi:hypothetical protein
MIKRSIGYNAPANVKLQLYKSLCRSNLEYSSQVWSPHSKQGIKSLESVQRGMTRYIVGSSDLSYSERCKHLNLLPLSYRREIMDLTYMYKYLNGALDVDYGATVTMANIHPSLRSSSHGFKLQSSLVRTEAFKHSYFNRVASLWNALPCELRHCDNLQYFKDRVNLHYLNKLDHYDIDNSCTWTTVCRCHSCRCHMY